MSKDPQLSIVLPVYNVAPYLEECLSSIQAQTFADFEVILVDDGSTDLSGSICDWYAHIDNRFKVIHQDNAGVSAARNVGIEEATAPLLAFIDPDDYISPNYFSELIAEMRRVDADVAACKIHFLTEDGKTHPATYAVELIYTYIDRSHGFFEMLNNDAVIKGVYNNVFSCVSWGKVYRRELWGNARFPIGIDLGEDMMTVPGVIINADRAVRTPKAIYYYRQRKRSLLHGTVSKERYLKDLAASSAMLEQLCAHSPENSGNFQLLKWQYDSGCFASYLRSNPEETKHRSKLHILAQAKEDFCSNDVIEAMLKRLGWNNE